MGSDVEMRTIALTIIDKSGIFKKVHQKAEVLCYAMLWGSWFLCLTTLF